MLPHAGCEQRYDPPEHHPEHQHGRYVSEAPRLHGKVRRIRLHYALEIELLALRLIPGLIQEQERVAKFLLRKIPSEGQLLVIGGLR